MATNSTRAVRHIKASREEVFAVLIDPVAIAKWKVPDGMTLEVHEFEGWEGGRFRISLTYEAPDLAGKTSAHTDTYHGRYLEIVAGEKVVEVDEFETSDPSLGGEMTITITLREEDGGTELTALHEGLPSGVAVADNEEGWRMSLDKLAALVENAR